MFLTKDGGVLNKIIVALGGEPIFWYAESKYWPAIITISGIWKNVGWGTIVFLSAITNINPDLYEAAKMDGAGRIRQCIHVTIPGIMPAITMTFILCVAGIVKDDFDHIYALVGDSSILSETTEVLGTWVYKTLKGGFRGWGDATAVGLVQSVAGALLMAGSNWLVRKQGQEGLW
jgi:putative aldouronate transport system permease protein